MAVIVIAYQGFLMPDNETIMKEVAIVDVTSNMEKQMISKPPCCIKVFSARFQAHLRYVADKIHGIPWCHGYMDIEDVEEQVKKAVDEADIVYVKGLVRVNYLLNLTKAPIHKIVNLDEFPNISKTVDRNHMFRCQFKGLRHSNLRCALEQAIRYRDYLRIEFKTPYVVGLKSFVTYNSIFNVTSKNNKIDLIYRPDFNTANNKTLEGEETEDEEWSVETLLPEKLVKYNSTEKPKKQRHEHYINPGIYELQDLFEEIYSFVPSHKTLKFQLSTKQQKVTMTGDLGVDLTSSHSIAPLLGFERRKYFAAEVAKSTVRVDIFPINTIRVRCNLVKSNISDCKLNDDTIYEFPLNVAPGEKIIERVDTATFYKVNTDTIYQLHLKIVDQDDRLVDFRGERVNILLEFKPAP
ncbi:hypothetical protein V9T40_013061 [Parthenolecanium corni]|uniref:Uncharacterized protein n=1 Tax=Parthenolecanium corni TaxID=536013 RepID=A0AAN9TAN4_9HEMI